MATHFVKMKINFGDIQMEQEFGDKKNKVVKNGIKSGQNILMTLKTWQNILVILQLWPKEKWH